MKRRIIPLAVALALVLGISAQAAVWANAVVPVIEFNGTTAICTVTARGEADDAITVRAKLWQGSTCLKDWQASGTGSVTLSRTATVEEGKTYRLTADVTIGGVKQSTKSYSATCP